MSGLIRDRYEPIGVVGRGAQGEVLRALDRVHGREVAIKVRRIEGAGAAEDVLAEARALLALPPHRGLPTLREDFVEEDRYHLVMDWIEGESLAELLERRGEGIPFEEALGLLAQVAEALDHLHARDPPICHRDVKPANIIVSPGGGAVLVDFGIAARPGSGAGTPGYVAPEVLAGDAPTPASDVFSLAVSAATVLLGRAPSFGEAPDLGAVPEALRDRVEKSLRRGLASDPALRPPSAGALLAALRAPPGRTNLPAPLSSFVGRARELAGLRRALGSSRLVTVTGMGGGGKTRLAIEAAREAAPALPAGVWFVGLASVVEPDLVTQAVADAIGLRDEGGGDLWARLREVLGRGHQLLVLDNCEHLLDPLASLVASLLEACPRLRILATSRERLDLVGEGEFRLAPLSLPAPGAGPIDAARAEAVALFLDRARAAASFEPLDGALDAAVRICRTVEGIPLAIEIAAARLRDWEPTELASRLEEELGALGRAQRGAPARQRTLEATLAWSHDLLAQKEREVFRRLSVFAGGFYALAVAQACEIEDPAPVLMRLADKSLLVATSRNGTVRFAMLEVVRQYAARLLAEAGEEPQSSEGHLRWLLELVSEEVPRLRGPEVVEALATLEAEHDNLRAAVARAITSDRPPGAALTLVTKLGAFWALRGYLTEGRRWIEAAIAARPAEPALEALALEHGGLLAERQGELSSAGRQLTRALELWTSIGDRAGEARALCLLGMLDPDPGDLSAGRSHVKRALEIQREIGDEREIARTLNTLGAMTTDDDQARKRLVESLEMSRRFRNLPAIAATMTNLGIVSWRRGDPDEARRMFTEAFQIQRALGDRVGTVRSLLGLGAVAEMQGEFADARVHYEESVALSEELGDAVSLARTIVSLGGVASELGDFESARRFAERALEIQPQLEDKIPLATCLGLLAIVALETGELEVARARAEESLAIRRELGDPRAVGRALHLLGNVALVEGDLPRAGALSAEALAEHRAAGDRAGMGISLEACGAVLAARGDAARAVRLIAAAGRVLESRGGARFLGDRRRADEALAAARAALGAEFEAEWAAGEALELEAAVELALRALGSNGRPAPA